MWTVVQKTKRQRKPEPKGTNVEATSGKGSQGPPRKEGKPGGSRFVVLHSEPANNLQTETCNHNQQQMEIILNTTTATAQAPGQSPQANTEQDHTPPPTVTRENPHRRNKKDTSHSQTKIEVKPLNTLKDKNGINVKAKFRDPSTTMSNHSIDRLKRDLQQVNIAQKTSNLADYINQVVYNNTLNLTPQNQKIGIDPCSSIPMELSIPSTKKPPDKITVIGSINMENESNKTTNNEGFSNEEFLGELKANEEHSNPHLQ